jgi:hypothetical protein
MTKETETPKCRAGKHGVVDLECELPLGHADDYKPGTESEEGWHKSVLTRHEDITYSSSHHVIHITETVTWEPVDHVAEATRHLMAARGKS